MSELETQAKAIAARAREVLETSVRERRSFNAVIFTWRGEQEVALVWPPQHLRDVILEFAYKAAKAFSADLLAVVFDAWTTLHDGGTGEGLNPLTHEPWKSGDMQDLAQHHHGIERGWVSESLNVHISNRAGDAAMAILPYRREHGRRITWLEPPNESPNEMKGVMPDALARIMKEPVLEQMMEQAVPGMLGAMSAEEAARLRNFTDLESAKRLGMDGATVALTADPGSPRAAYFIEHNYELIRPPWSDN